MSGQAIGYIVYKIGDNRRSLYGHVISLYIDQKYRGNQLSDKLIQFVLKKLADLEISILRLEVTANNEAAIKSYERNGFKIARLEMECMNTLS